MWLQQMNLKIKGLDKGLMDKGEKREKKKEKKTKGKGGSPQGFGFQASFHKCGFA